MRRRLLASVVVAVLAVPATALGQEAVPPGSAGDQYIEGVPGPAGESPSGQAGSGDEGGGPGAPGDALSPDAQAALEAEGALGDEVAGLAAATAPDGEAGRQGTALNETQRGGSASDDSGSRLEEVFTALTGSSSDGMGLVLPAILGSSLLVALMFLLARHRRGTAETS